VCMVSVCLLSAGTAGEFGPWRGVQGRDEASARDRNSYSTGALSLGSRFLLLVYREGVSPQDGHRCRYEPSCSRYGDRALARYGFLVGGFLAGERIIRCNPSSPGGLDPLPSSPGRP
jgi:hypothetical protein